MVDENNAQTYQPPKIYPPIECTHDLAKLLDEYFALRDKCHEMEKAHPTPTGGEDFDYLYLRDDMDYRWYQSQMSEIRNDIGWLIVGQVKHS